MASPDFKRALETVNRRGLTLLTSHLCSLLAGVLYVGWMILLAFCMDLLDHKGLAVFTGEDAKYASSVHPLAEPGVVVNPYRARNTGLLPTLVRLRGEWYGPALERLYRSVPATRNDIGLLMVIFMAALAIGAVRLILLVIQSRLLVAATGSAQARLQKQIFEKQFSLEGAYVDPGQRTRVEMLLRDDLPAMLRAVRFYMERIVREPAKIVALVLFAMSINLPLASTFLILSVLAWIVARRVVATYVTRGTQLDQAASAAMEKLLGLAGSHRVIAGYLADGHYGEAFDRYVRQSRQATEAKMAYEGRLIPLWQFVGLLIFIIVLTLAAQNVLAAKFELAAAAGLFASLLSVALPINNLIAMRQTVATGTEAAGRVFSYLGSPSPARMKEGNAIVTPVTDAIDFEKVSYEDQDGQVILQDISIRIRRGQRIAIMAKSDQERRCFIYLLARFLEPTAGRIKFDGTEIRRASLESLRRQVAVVFQDMVLLPDTVAGNISCGDSIFRLAEITEAAKVAHAHNFIQRLPSGYECVIGDGGFPLKRGEAYRIALARAILRDPPIVCIEEPQEQLDPDTKALLDDTMNRFCQGRTVIVLPSRISTLRACDQVFLLNDGKLANVGTHRELLATSELYRHLQYVDFYTPSFAT